jgi:hypothetical protein
MSAQIEEVVACDYEQLAWLWTHGWVNKRKFKGECLSRTSRRGFDTDFEEIEIVKGKVVHGWILTIAGDLSGCGWDATMYMERDEPVIIDGRWAGHEGVEYDDDDNEVDVDAQVIDGPHKATWLEPRRAD